MIIMSQQLTSMSSHQGGLVYIGISITIVFVNVNVIYGSVLYDGGEFYATGLQVTNCESGNTCAGQCGGFMSTSYSMNL